tara:strand:+ start:398 stop:601 length:204 start_codon:yes stop_codon:yes gene_type:complete
MLKLISTAQASFTTLKNKFIADDKGATAIEYGLIAVGIALAILATVQLVGTELDGAFKDVESGLKNR